MSLCSIYCQENALSTSNKEDARFVSCYITMETESVPPPPSLMKQRLPENAMQNSNVTLTTHFSTDSPDTEYCKLCKRWVTLA